ncbi:MAG: aminoacyl-tRNA hydrolase [Nitrospirae bacterium GWC2_57_13]|jgi:peptidyl-tRNA hydrolase, PTH1 family|nr:MAG: aminoacyl-tRNA hydrolase [Nitrospirae bacterium GWC2_57_13]OGW46583.1 MAG: aminoacyl-tRNA hydrolase [Nitrospirae bacterium GWD2_57_8]
MKIIVGLGNPGRKYERTRHNVGFLAVDELGRSLGIAVDREKCRALIGKGRLGPEQVVLAKPQTYMNESGWSLTALLPEFYASLADVIVIHDDLDLPCGTVRMKSGGGHGGHNGLRSIAEETGSSEFIRVRIGIGRPAPGMDAADFVLQPFSADERALAENAVAKAAEAVQTIITQGMTTAMNRFNQKQTDPDRA